MRHSTRHLTHVRSRRPVVEMTVHAARRPRRTHSSRVRFIHAAGASLALAALGYLATAKAETAPGLESTFDLTAAAQRVAVDRD